jgi:hypothetical protein
MPAASKAPTGALLHLSSIIRDPFVRRACERAECEDGTAPAVVVIDQQLFVDRIKADRC